MATAELTEIVQTPWRWTPEREKAALAMASCKTQQDAAKQAGVSDKSIQRWLQYAEFQERVTEHTRAIVRRARWKLESRAADAADMVIDIMLFGTNKHMTRLTAAKDILDRVGLKAPEKHEHEHSGTIEHHSIALQLEGRLLDLARRGAGAALPDEPEQ